MTIAFMHPDLGIGGAERLVVDAAMHLGSVGHRVSLFTAHHDPSRCFDETRDGRLDVHVYGDFMPMQVGQHLRAPCAIARMHYLACRMAARKERFDVVFCDLVPHAIPVMRRLLTRAKIIFYCHFPDQLMAPRREGWYRWYRAPIDRWEEAATGAAHLVLVNSEFTASVFRRVFPHLRTMTPKVLYPGVDVARYSCPPLGNGESRIGTPDIGAITILSFGRYERTKNVSAAIKALATLRERITHGDFARLQLIVAGGFDDRLAENRATFASLRALASDLGLNNQVVFLRSPTEAQRLEMLSRCFCLVNTAPQEHFGYVVVEAMAAGRPVVAANGGGPAETVVNGVTGLLCEAAPNAFAAALLQLIGDPEAAARMGRAGREHVAGHFSRAAFGARLEQLVDAAAQERS